MDDRDRMARCCQQRQLTKRIYSMMMFSVGRICCLDCSRRCLRSVHMKFLMHWGQIREIGRSRHDRMAFPAAVVYTYVLWNLADCRRPRLLSRHVTTMPGDQCVKFLI